MGKRKNKNAVKQVEDHEPLILEPPPVPKSKPSTRNHYVLMCFLLLIIVVGGPLLSWLCYQQQQSIDDLADTFSTMQMKFVKFQQQEGFGNAKVGPTVNLMEQL